MPRVPDLAQGTGCHLVFEADPAHVRAALVHLMAAPPLAALTDSDRGTVELVLAEVLNNIAEHAYAGQSGPVRVDLRRRKCGIACRIADNGLAMPSGTLPVARMAGPAGLALAELPEGGFGWHLIRSLTHGLAYSRRKNINRLCFVIPLG